MGSSLARFIPCFAILACCAMAISQTEPDKVQLSYTNYGSSLKHTLEELSEKSGVKLLCSAQYVELPLTIDVKDISLRKLMDRIAKVCHAEWKEENSGWWLQRSAQLEKQEADDVFHRRVESYAKALKERKEEVAGYKEFDQTAADFLATQIGNQIKSSAPTTYQQYDAMRRKTPSWRLMDRIAISLSPEFLASIPQGKRVVLSTGPTRMQSPMPVSVNEAMQRYIAEQTRWLKSMRQFPIPSIEQMSEGNPRAAAYMLLQDRYAPEGAPAKVLVSIFREYGAISLQLETLFVDKQGRTKLVGFTSLDSLSSRGPRPKLEEQKGEKPFAFDEIAEELAERISGSFENGMDTPWTPPSKDLLDRLTNPEKYEPVGLGAGQLFAQCAASRKLQLVACIPDDLFSCVPPKKQRIRTPSQTLDWLIWVYSNRRNFTIEDGCLFVSWSQELEGSSTDKPLSRSAIGPILRQIANEKRFSLETEAQLSLLRPFGYFFAYEMGLAAVDDTWDNVTRYGPGDIQMLQLHGSLTAAQRRGLSQGGALRLQELTTFQRGLIAELVFDQRLVQIPNLTLVDENSPDRTQMDQPDPTEVFPNGLPSNLELKCVVTHSQGLNVRMAGYADQEFVDHLSLEEVAWHVIEEERGNNTIAKEPMTGFQIIDNLNYEYTIQLSPEAFVTTILQDTKSNGSWVKSIKDLPEDIQAEIQKQVDKLRKERPPHLSEEDVRGRR